MKLIGTQKQRAAALEASKPTGLTDLPEIVLNSPLSKKLHDQSSAKTVNLRVAFER